MQSIHNVRNIKHQVKQIFVYVLFLWHNLHTFTTKDVFKDFERCNLLIKHLYIVVISVCLTVCPIINYEPPTDLPQILIG